MRAKCMFVSTFCEVLLNGLSCVNTYRLEPFSEHFDFQQGLLKQKLLFLKQIIFIHTYTHWKVHKVRPRYVNIEGVVNPYILRMILFIKKN